MVFRAAPLKSSFMLVGIIGFLISALFIYGKNPTWGFTLSIFFLLMIIAALVSMTKSKPVLPLYSRKK